MARATRRHYIDAAIVAGEEMRRVVRALQGEYKRRGTGLPLRRLEAARDSWAKVSRDGCLRQEIKLAGRHLTIGDLRATGSVAKQPDWSSEELGICVIGNVVDAKPLGMFWREPLLVGVSLHALARWFQRALDNGRDALEADLLTIAEASQSVVEDRQANAAVPTSNGGA